MIAETYSSDLMSTYVKYHIAVHALKIDINNNHNLIAVKQGNLTDLYKSICQDGKVYKHHCTVLAVAISQ